LHAAVASQTAAAPSLHRNGSVVVVRFAMTGCAIASVEDHGTTESISPVPYDHGPIHKRASPERALSIHASTSLFRPLNDHNSQGHCMPSDPCSECIQDPAHPTGTHLDRQPGPPTHSPGTHTALPLPPPRTTLAPHPTRSTPPPPRLPPRPLDSPTSPHRRANRCASFPVRGWAAFIVSSVEGFVADSRNG
jgi:hypothetical protein